MTTITGVSAFDIRFQTSRFLDGSDAMNPDPDYSTAYCILSTSDGTEGHGFTFTLGRGTELCVHGIESLAPKTRTRIAAEVHRTHLGIAAAVEAGDRELARHRMRRHLEALGSLTT